MIPPVAPGQVDEKQNMVGWKNTFNMRQVTFMNLPSAQLGVKNGSRPNFPVHKRPYSITSSAKSLDLLRRNLQSAINRDIDNVIRKYLDKFFQPAVVNIKNNLGKDSVNEDHIKEVCKQMLEDAKSMYKISPVSRDSSPYDYSDSEASTTDGRLGRMSPVSGKRKESDTDSESNNIPTQKRYKIKTLSMTDFTNYKLPIKREAPKWDPERITKNTLFIMGARANKVLGYGQTRGRLYVRHPDLVRYSGDQEDKEWLASKNLMPPSGGKAYLMLLEDIKELTHSDDYKSSPNLQLHELRGFEVPIFLMSKIKNFIESVRTDKKPCLGSLDLFDFRSQSITPPNVALDSGPSTPSDTVQLVESQPDSMSSKSDNFIGIPEMSPNSNNSIMSATLTQSPVPVTSSLFSPGMMLSMGTADSSNNLAAAMMMKEATHNENCLSNVLVGQITSDNSQGF